ncbi:MAG: 23S rRNA (uracil(1939)-C(5))-methyltransferase RlmD [Planctomycetes bacterium]|nr:23S rRNA (uracil(1939)-C(5))-methyltransferase RlmD [Planctomycetota bacterium]
MKNGVELELCIERIVPGGYALGRFEDQPVHVPFAVPGDRVRVRVTGRRKRRLEAELLEVLEPSPLRVEPRCRYFGECGGCRWQNLSYAAQLDAKRQAVEQAFAARGLLRGVEVAPVIGAERTWFYRNKMEFSFGARRWLTAREVASGERFDRGFALGMNVPGFFDRLLDLHECHLQSELSARLVNGVRELAREQDWSAWDVRKKEGYLRHLVIRTPERSTEVLLNVVTSSHDSERMEKLAAFLRAAFPQVTTLVNTINSGVAQVAFGEAMHTVFGPGMVRDRIGRHSFEIAPHSFFQTNTVQAERLYEVARESAGLRATDLVFDLYSGVGAIALFFSDHVRLVVGLEIDAQAVAAARRAAAENGVRNATFEAVDLGSASPARVLEGFGRPDVVVLDPPRAGIHPRMAPWIASLGARTLVYVSCNPETQARDLELLAARYELARVQPVDLFPHTDHVENVASLEAVRVPF